MRKEEGLEDAVYQDWKFASTTPSQWARFVASVYVTRPRDNRTGKSGVAATKTAAEDRTARDWLRLVVPGKGKSGDSGHVAATVSVAGKDSYAYTPEYFRSKNLLARGNDRGRDDNTPAEDGGPKPRKGP